MIVNTREISRYESC